MEKVWAVCTARCGATKDLVWTDGGDPSRPPWEGFGGDWIDCNTEENARLVAAAPDLLEALEAALARMEEDWHIIDDARGPTVSTFGDIEGAVASGHPSTDAIRSARAAIAKATGATT